MVLAGRWAAVALMVVALCSLATGAQAAQQTAPKTATGRLEVTLMRAGVNVTSQYMVMATSESAPMPVMLTLSGSGAMAADLPVGRYTVVAILASVMSNPASMAGQMPTAFDVMIAAGKTIQKVAEVAGAQSGQGSYGGYGGFDEADEDDEFGGDGEPVDLDRVPTVDEPVDLDRVPTVDELLELARGYQDSYWALLDGQEQWAVEQMTRRLKVDAGASAMLTSEDVSEVTTAAAAIVAPGASRETPVVLAARAVIAMPDMALAVNNFGAILRLLGELRDSVTVLLAARRLDPQSPMILTNLANSAYELGDDRAAELLYNEALRANDSFGPALTALGNIYMERGDYEKALATMLKGAQLGFCAAVKDACSEAMDNAYGGPDSIPPLPPPWQGGMAGVASGSSGAGGGGGATFTVPQMADWSSIQSLAGYMRGSGFTRLKAAIEQGLASGTLEMERIAEEIRSAATQRAGKSKSGSRMSFQNQSFHLRLIYDHFQAIVSRAVGRAQDQMEYEQGWDEYHAIEERYLRRIQAARTEPQLEAANAAFCEEASGFARAQFARNKGLWTQFYNEAASAVLDYWAFSQNVLDSIYDPLVYRHEETARRLKVYGMLAEITGTCGQLAALPIIHSDCGRCGGTGQPPKVSNEVNVPRGSDKCPFKNGRKFALSLGPVEYKVDCSTVEVGVTMIGSGSLKWDFKQKRVTSIFVGVGGQMGAGAVSVGSKWGTQITFDTDGSVSDFTADWSTSVGVGPASAEIGIDSGLVVGGPGMQVTIAP
ncbi:MAG TPA: tetratricopeptide repeat protein [Bacillota bacterium]|nr:tetratricopeptide repeat protein [Bacillota bacterium]